MGDNKVYFVLDFKLSGDFGLDQTFPPFCLLGRDGKTNYDYTAHLDTGCVALLLKSEVACNL